MLLRNRMKCISISSPVCFASIHQKRLRSMTANMLLGPVKAGFEVLCGDEEGAADTMNDFSQTNPLIMPFRLVGDLLTDDRDDANETFDKFCKNMVNTACSVPVLGHAIGLGCAAAGDEEKGAEICKQATRTTVVAAAGLAGSIAGPVVTVGAAVAAGTEWDLIEAAAGGRVNGVARLVEAGCNGTPMRPGEVFDSCMVPVGDGLTGLAASQLYQKLQEASQQNLARQQAENSNNAKVEALERRIIEVDQGVDDANKLAKDMSAKAHDLREQVNTHDEQLRAVQEGQPGRNINNYHRNGHVSCTMIDENGNEATGYSKRLTDANGMQRFEESRSLLHRTHPFVEPVRGWLDNCAEHMAYENCPNPSLTYALQIKDGIVKTVERCANCAQYDLGTVITDFVNGEPVPFDLVAVPPAGSYIGAGIQGIVLITVQDKRPTAQS